MRGVRRVLAVVATALVVLPACAAAATSSSAAGSTPVATTGMTTTTTSPPTGLAGSPTVTETQTATVTTTTTTATTATHAAHARVPRHVTTTHKTHVPAPPAVSGWLSPTAKLPQRAMVLSAPGQTLSSGDVGVSENGTALTKRTVTPLTSPGRGDFAVTFAVDQSATMAGQGLAGAMSAARTFAGGRSPNVSVGLVTYAATPTLQLAQTTNATIIDSDLGTPPASSATTADLATAMPSILAQLRHSGAAVPVAVVISDGVDSVPLTAAELSALGRAHVQVITVGVEYASTNPARLARLRHSAPGIYVQTTPALLGAKVDSELSALQSDTAVVRWRSTARAGASVAVAGVVGGATGTVQARYAIPRPNTPAKPAKPAGASGAGHRAASTPAVAKGASALSPSPAFTLTTPSAAPVPATQGFWHTGAAKLVTALIVALLVGAIIMLLLRRPSREGVRHRVGSYIPTSDEGLVGELVSEQSSRKGLLSSLQKGSFWPPFVEAVEVSRNPKSPSYLMKRAGLISLLVGLLLALLSHIVFLFIVPIIAFPFVERWWVFRAATKQRDKFRDTLPSYMQDMASALRVGRSFIGAMAIVADSADEPSRSEFDRAVTDESLGRPLEESLQAVGQRMQSLEMDQIALIAELNRRSGSNVAEALDRVAEGARDRADLMREMKALTAQAKMSSGVLTGMPLVLLLSLSVIAPSYAHPLFHTGFGWVAVAFAAILVLTGRFVMKKISNVGV